MGPSGPGVAAPNVARPARRRGRIAAGAAAVAVLALLAVGVLLLMRDDDPAGAERSALDTTAEQASTAAQPAPETEAATPASAATAPGEPAPESVSLPASDAVAAFGGGAGPQQAFATGVRPTAVAVDGDVLWVANAGDRTVSRIDLGSGDARTIGTAEVPSGLAVGSGAVWVANGFADQVSRIDPAPAPSWPASRSPAGLPRSPPTRPACGWRPPSAVSSSASIPPTTR